MNDAAAAISPAVQDAPQRATWRFLLANPLHVIALGFGSGLAPRAPGTVGTLWAWAAFLILRPYLDDAQWAWLIGAGFVLGCWASAVTARHLGKRDPGCVVWDEVIAFWIVLWLVTPASLLAQTIAFALFRLFDEGEIRPGAGPERFIAALLIHGKRIVLEVTASSVQNPFRLRELVSFSCPGRM